MLGQGDGLELQFVLAEIGNNATTKAEISGVGLAPCGIERIQAVFQSYDNTRNELLRSLWSAHG